MQVADAKNGRTKRSESARSLLAARKPASARVSYFSLVFVVSLVIPVFFYMGPLRLAPFLLLLVIAFLPLVLVWASGGAGRIRIFDFLILFSCLWGVLALFKAHGFGNAIEPAGVLLVQTFGGYLMGRCLVRNKESVRALLFVSLSILIIIFPFATWETLTGTPLYLDLFSNIGSVYDNVWMEPRLGLDRVQGAFEHPILFGIFVSSFFGMSFYILRGFWRILMISLSVLLAVFSVSTGAIVCLGVQVGIIMWGIVFRKDRHRWRNLVLVCLGMYIFVDLLSDRTPFNVFVDYLTFNSGSAYNRILIWKYGSAEVLRNPLFGIGLNQWERPVWMSDSMDNFWLLIAVRYGLPSLIALFLAFVLILTKIGKRKFSSEEIVRIRRGMTVSIVGIFVAICSVHLWNATFCWLMFLIGSTVWILEAPTQPGPRQRVGLSPQSR